MTQHYYPTRQHIERMLLKTPRTLAEAKRQLREMSEHIRRLPDVVCITNEPYEVDIFGHDRPSVKKGDRFRIEITIDDQVFEFTSATATVSVPRRG